MHEIFGKIHANFINNQLIIKWKKKKQELNLMVAI
jgi:hypothetical protein